MAGYATQCGMSENPILIFYWFYNQNRAGDASGIHTIAIGHVGKQIIDIPLVLCENLEQHRAGDAGVGPRHCNQVPMTAEPY